MTMLSRVLGLIRDVVLANLLGATLMADVFLFAQKIPNFLRRLFAEGAFAQAFVPVLKDIQHHQSRELLLIFINRMAGTLGAIVLVVTILGVIGSKLLVGTFGFGFLDQPVKFELANQLLKITFPYLFFITLAGFCGALLNSVQRFAVPAFAPVLLNLSIIAAALFVAPQMEQPSRALAWSIFIAGVMQLFIHIPFLWREGLLPKPSWGWQDKGVKRVVKLMIPALFGVSVAQINLLIDTMLATSLVTGSISWLYYSDRLLEFPLGVFGIAIATVVLPSLSQQVAESSEAAYQKTLNWALQMVLLIGVPAAIGLALMAEPMMLTIFQHGSFTELDAYRAGLSLMAYSLGLPFFMLIKILATAFYARQDTRTPVKIGIIAMVTNIFLNLALYKPLGHVGLALATSLSAMLNAGLLYQQLRKKNYFEPGSGWLLFWSQTVAASCALTGVVWYLNPSISLWQAEDLWFRISQLALVIGASVLAYVLILVIMGVRKDNLMPKH
jgi:putative peptidoglycan lipid II flippase